MKEARHRRARGLWWCLRGEQEGKGSPLQHTQQCPGLEEWGAGRRACL